MRLGSTAVTNLRLGTSQVQRVYMGTALAWSWVVTPQTWTGSVGAVTVTPTSGTWVAHDYMYYSDFSEFPTGDTAFLPRTGWVSNDWDDGGHTYDTTWRVLEDGSGSVLYNSGNYAHLHYDTGSAGHEVEASVRLNAGGSNVVAGVVVGVENAGGTNLIYVGFELVIVDGVENKLLVYFRDTGTHDEYKVVQPAGLVKDRWYKMRLRYVGGVVSAWLDDVLFDSRALSSGQASSLVGHTRAGLINYNGANNWDYVVLRRVVAVTGPQTWTRSTAAVAVTGVSGTWSRPTVLPQVWTRSVGSVTVTATSGAWSVPAAIYEDDFESYADGSTYAPGGWTVSGATWTIYASGAGGAHESKVVYPAPGTQMITRTYAGNIQRIDTRVRVTSSSYIAGLLVGFANTNNLILLTIVKNAGEDAVKLYIRSGGTFTLLDTYTASPVFTVDSFYDLTVQINKTSGLVEGYLGTTLVCDATLTAPQLAVLGTGAGMYSDISSQANYGWVKLQGDWYTAGPPAAQTWTRTVGTVAVTATSGTWSRPSLSAQTWTRSVGTVTVTGTSGTWSKAGGGTTEITEPFTYANGALATVSSGLWVHMNGPSGGVMVVASNKAVGVNNAAGEIATRHATQVSSADCFAQAALTGGGNYTEGGVFVRKAVASTDRTFYLATLSTTDFKIYEVTAGTYVPLVTSGDTLGSGATKTVRLEAQGSTLRAYIDGVLKLTTTDNTLTTGRIVGMEAYNNTTPLVQFDDFTAGIL